MSPNGLLFMAKEESSVQGYNAGLLRLELFQARGM